MPYSLPVQQQQLQIQPKTCGLSEQEQIYLQYANFLQQPQLQSTLEHQLSQQQLHQLQNPAANHLGGVQLQQNSIGELKIRFDKTKLPRNNPSRDFDRHKKVLPVSNKTFEIWIYF